MVENARRLVEYGANINFQDHDGWAILPGIVFWNEHRGIQFLLDEGADYTLRLNDGDSVLHVVARFGDLGTIRILTGAVLSRLDSDALDETGRTALQVSEGRMEEGKEWHEAFGALIDSIRERYLVYEKSFGAEGESMENLLEKMRRVNLDKVLGKSEVYSGKRGDDLGTIYWVEEVKELGSEEGEEDMFHDAVEVH